VDLTHDGIVDILSGSYPGEIYLFVGNQDGTFQKSIKIQNKHGKDLKVDRAAAVFAVDWDRDGDLDLVIGNIKGEVCFVPNEGAEGTNVFGDPVKIQAGGEKISVPRRNAGPCVADWDCDGIPDLVVGCGDASVLFFRNTTDRGMPVLEKGVQLVGPGNTHLGGKASAQAGKGGSRAYRAKVCVADWNADGLPDLLVGDCISKTGKAPTLTAEQEAERDRLQKERQAVLAEYQVKIGKMQEKLQAEHGYSLRNVPDSKRKAVLESWRKLIKEDEGYMALSRKQSDIYRKLRKYQAPRSTHGYVSVYLRKEKPRTL